jgi:hypothetical protein
LLGQPNSSSVVVEFLLPLPIKVNEQTRKGWQQQLPKRSK